MQSLAHFNVLADAWMKHVLRQSNGTRRARRRAGPAYNSDRADMVCHCLELSHSSVKFESPSVANSRTPITLSLSHPECRTIQCAEECSADSSTQHNLRHLLSTARRTGLLSICSCAPFAKVAHESLAWSRSSLPTFLWERSRCKIKGSSMSYSTKSSIHGCKLVSPFSVV